MDFEATQAIALSDLDDDETDDEVPEDEKKPVAYLKVQGQKGFPEAKLPVYEGVNLIGRDSTCCNVHIALKALSKQHACIEVAGGNHMLYDKGSRNKSRKGKMYLTPEVRYNIQNNEELIFADVKCTYLIENKNAGEGDETDPGSEGAPLVDLKEQQTVMYEVDEDEEGEEELPSSDLLQPTQAYHTDGTGPMKKQPFLAEATQLYEAVESDEESEEITDQPFAKTSLVAETPEAKRGNTGVALEATQYIAESDSEGEAVDPPTTERKCGNEEQTVKFEDMATMAYDMVPESDTDTEDDSKDAPQAVAIDLEGATQAYTMAPEDEDTAKELLAKNRSPRPKRSPRTLTDEPTMAYDMDVESTQTAEEILKARKEAAKGHQTDPNIDDDVTDDENMATQTFTSAAKDVHDDDIATQTFSANKAESAEKSTVAIDLGGGTMEYEYDSDEDDVSLITMTSSPYTRSEAEEATQAFTSDAPTMPAEEIAKEGKTETEEEDATQVFSDVTEQPPAKNAETVRTAEDDSETQVIDKDMTGDTQVFAADAPTMAITSTPPRKSALKKPKPEFLSDEENLSTLVLETTADTSTQVFPGADVGDTMILQQSPSPQKRKKVAFENEELDDEGATQAYAEGNLDDTVILDQASPKRKGRGRWPKKSAAEEKTATVVDDDKSVDGKLCDDSEAATQVFEEQDPKPDKKDVSVVEETQSFTAEADTLEMDSRVVKGGSPKGEVDPPSESVPFSPVMASTQIAEDAMEGTNQTLSPVAGLSETNDTPADIAASTFKKPPAVVGKGRKRGRPSKVASAKPQTESTPTKSTDDAEVTLASVKEPDDDICTQAYSTDDMASTQAYTDEPEEKVDEPIPEPEVKSAPAKGKAKGKVKARNTRGQASQQLEPTSNTAPTRSSSRRSRGKDAEPESTPLPPEPDDIATQAYEEETLEIQPEIPLVEEKRVNVTVKGRGKGKGKARGKNKAVIAEDEVATQAYEVEPEEDSEEISPIIPVSKGKAAKQSAEDMEEESRETSPVAATSNSKTTKLSSGKCRGSKSKQVSDDDEAATQAYTADSEESPTSEVVNTSVAEDETLNFLTLKGLQPSVSEEVPPTRSKRGRASLPAPTNKPPAKVPTRHGRASLAPRAKAAPPVTRVEEKYKNERGSQEQQPKSSTRRGRGRSPVVTAGDFDVSGVAKRTKSSVDGAPEGKVSNEVSTQRRTGRQSKVEGAPARVNEPPAEEVKEEVKDKSSTRSKRRGQAAKDQTDSEDVPVAGTSRRGKRKPEEELQQSQTAGRQIRGGKIQKLEVEDVKPSTTTGNTRKRGKHSTAVSSPIVKSEADSPETAATEPESQTRVRGREASVKSNSSQENVENEPPPKRGRSSSKVKNVKVESEKEVPTIKTEEDSPSSARGRSRRGTRGQHDQSDTESITSESSSRSSRRGQKARPTKEKLQRDSSTESEASVSQRRGAGKRGSITPASKGKKNMTEEVTDMAPPSTPARGKSLKAVESPGTPGLRRRTLEPRPKVMFTGVVDAHGQKVVKDLGGDLVESVYDCTHLVTDKVRRTVKFLCIVSRGLPIVSPTWLEKCKAAKAFIDASPFIVSDRENEKKFEFRLRESLNKASAATLLEGYKLHVTKSVLPEAAQMKDIIQCSGGQYLDKMPSRFSPNTVVVSCDADKRLWKPAKSAKIPIVSSEFILTGTLQQKIDTKKFQIE